MPRRPSISRCSLLCLVLAPAAIAPPATAATLTTLTYNVAGLPGGLSSSHPEIYTVQISPLLNGFDLALVQEDFGFHAELISQVDHEFLSEKDDSSSPDGGVPIGDGLNTFSRSPFEDFTRVTWDVCFGVFTNASDCLAPKGFSVARHTLEPGIELDVYDLHADAGSAPEDEEARRTQMRQLADFILANSAGRAVLVLGDTNSRYTRAGDILPELLATTGLSDAWVELLRDGMLPPVGESLRDCPDGGRTSAGCELVDKIFYRSSAEVEINPLAYQVEEALFVDPTGAPLSDHYAVSARFDIRAVPECGSSLALAIACAAVWTQRPRRRA